MKSLGIPHAELLRIFALEGFGAVFITHNLYEAVFLSTDVLVMSSRPGRILKAFEVPFPYPATWTFASTRRSPS